MKKLTIVVDATSIVNTGGLTHLYEILYHYEEKAHPAIKTIIIISSTKVLNSLPKKDIFKKSTPEYQTNIDKKSSPLCFHPQSYPQPVSHQKAFD